MGGTYTYDPAKITENGVDRMRFELGDTVIDNGPMTSPLCNEEYEAIISSSKNWKRAKLKLLEAIMMKLSYEVDTSVGGLSYSLGQRADRWRDMYEKLKKELKTAALPTGNASAIYGLGGFKEEEHYFHKDLHENKAKGV